MSFFKMAVENSVENEIQIFREVQLGSGAFGVVCRAKYDQLPCAAKLLHPSFLVPGNWAAEKFMQECSFLASLKHPHIVQFLGVHSEPLTGQAVLLMELMEESLTALLKRYTSYNQLLPLYIQIDICHDVSLALHYLHTQGIIHRDLSSNNVLLIGGRRAKITDFGMSKLTPNISTTTTLSSLTQVPGCPVYMPPEAWISPPIYTEKLDVFSFGVLTLQIATCRQPNPGPLETLIPDERSPTGFLKLPIPEAQRRSEHLSLMPNDNPLKPILSSCLNDKQDNRPSSRDLCHSVECIKSSSEYIEMSHSKTGGIEGGVGPLAPVVNSADSTDSGYTYDSNEIQSLKSKVSSNETELTKLRKLLSDGDAKIKVLEKQLKETSDSTRANSANDSTSKPHTMLHSNYEEKIISNLSPEILSILKTDPNICNTFHVDYNRDSVTFYHHSQKEDSIRRINLFLQMYQRLFNTGQARISFVRIPASFPRHHLSIDNLVSICSQYHSECTFEHMDNIDTIKILSKSSALNQLSFQLVTDFLNLTITLPGDRKLIVKHENVLDQKANVLVCSVLPTLSLVIGLGATLNTMTNFELQKQCDHYIHKHGQLKPGQVMHLCASTFKSLECDYIILAVGPVSSYADDRDDGTVKIEIEQILRTVTTASLDRAEKLKAATIAFPLLGSAKYEQEVSTKVVVDTIMKYKCHYLKEVVVAVAEERFVSSTCQVLLERGAHWSKKEYDSVSSKSNKSCKHQ